MPYRRKTVKVYIQKAKYQSPKKTLPERGIYSWDLVWIDETGKRCQKTFQGHKKDADNEAFAISLKLQNILKLDPMQYSEIKKRRTPLEDAPTIYWEAREKEGSSQASKDIFEYSWKYFVEGNREDSLMRRSKEAGTISGLAPKHMRNFKAYLRTKSFGYKGKSFMSPHTQGKYFRTLKAGLKWLHEDDYIEKDPTRGVKGISLPTIKVTSLTPEQVRYALEKTKEHPRGDEIYALILAYLYLGCRATEILPPYFTWDKFHGHTIERPNLKQKKAEVEWITISLVGEDGEALRKILEKRLKDKEKWSAPFPYGYWGVRSLLTGDFFPSIGLKANIQMLRDTAATLRQISGQSLGAVSSLLGHSNPAVTMKYYTDKVQLLGSVAGSLNITVPSDKISNSLNAEGIGKNEISNTFQQDLKKQKTPQKEGLFNEDSSVARDRIELPTQGFSVLCSTD